LTSPTAEPTRTIPFGRPWIGDTERAAVDEVLRGPILTHGPRCKEFERGFGEFMGPEAQAVTVSSCMAALHLAYLDLGLQPGDEVIVPAQTHAATAHAVEWLSARPVFVDCEPETGNVTAERIAPHLTERTRAISLVHFVGIPCEMPAIVELAAERGLYVVEDCALAVGGRYDGRHVGLFGDVGCFSFYPVKHLTTAEGGMFVSRHAEVTARVERLRAFGVDRRHDERSVPGMYDVPTLGLNYRMSEVQAAIGIAQLARVDENLDRRRTNFRTIRDALASVPGIRVLDAKDDRAENSHYCLTVVLDAQRADRRRELIAEFVASGVGTSLYYPQPVPRLTYYRERYGWNESDFPNATAISDRSIALPVGPHLEPDDAEYIAEQAVRVLSEVRS
jgi:perosamine synthetase